MAASKPESTFIKGVHKHLTRTYSEKMNNPWRSGTADVWYSGDKGDLWVEYKFIERIPRSIEIVPNLSPRQRRWLNNRYDDGRNIAVILGTPSGGVIYTDKTWMSPLTSTEMEAQLVPKDEIARWIYNQVGGSKCLL